METNAKRAELHRLLASDEILVLPGVADPWTAKIARRAGFGAVFATGAGIANVDFGVPDVGLVTASEMSDVVGRICGSVDIPVVADADTGYGNALNVIRTVETFERMGVAGIMLEDQVTPKKCGHFAGKELVPLNEMLEKIAAFRRVGQGEAELTLIARTDAIGVAGYAEAIRRARAFAQAGADVIFVEAPRSSDELAQIPNDVAAPVLANMVEGGVTPLHSATELKEMGYSAVYFANMAMRIAGKAMQRAFERLKNEGTTVSLLDDMLSWDERQALVDFETWQSIEAEIESSGAQLMRDL